MKWRVKSSTVSFTGRAHTLAILLAKVIHPITRQDLLTGFDGFGDFELDGKAFSEKLDVVVTVMIDEPGGTAEDLKLATGVDDMREIGRLPDRRLRG